MEVFEAIARRQSCRRFTAEKVTPEQVEKLLLAANAAPVGRALYGNVHLTVITNEQLLSELETTAAEVNGNPSGHPLYGCTTLVLVSATLAEGEMIPSSNVGCMMENMTLAAVDMGLSSVYIAGVFRAIVGAGRTDLLTKLRLPEGFTPVGALAVGHAAAPEQPRTLTLDKIAVDYLR